MHSIYIGFFDRQAAKLGKLVVTRPIDMQLAHSMFVSVGSYDNVGMAKIGTDRFSFEVSYLRCLDFVKTRQAADFIANVAVLNKCDILFLELGKFYTAPEYLETYDIMEARRKQRKIVSTERGRTLKPLPGRDADPSSQP